MSEKMVTPIGEAYWVKINGTLDKYEDNILGYSLRLKLSDKDTEKLEEKLINILEEAKADEKFKGKKWLSEPFIGLTEDAEGNKMFKFKARHEFTRDDGTVVKNVIPIYDAKRNRISDDIKIGNGSKIKVSFTPNPFNVNARVNGLSLRLNAIQVIDLIEYNGGSNGSDFGFTEEEGYVSPTNEFDDDEIPI